MLGEDGDDVIEMEDGSGDYADGGLGNDTFFALDVDAIILGGHGANRFVITQSGDTGGAPT